MLVTNLKCNILEFISTFGFVSQEQIDLMFRNHSPGAVQYHLHGLLHEHNIFVDEYKRYQINRNSTLEAKAQERLSQAAWVIAFFGSHNIRSYYVTNYPIQVSFITCNNKAYDVTLVALGDAKLTTQVAKRVMRMDLPEGEKDEIKHIALCTHKKVISDIDPYNVFDYYALRHAEKGLVIKDIRTGVTLDVE